MAKKFIERGKVPRLGQKKPPIALRMKGLRRNDAATENPSRYKKYTIAYTYDAAGNKPSRAMPHK